MNKLHLQPSLLARDPVVAASAAAIVSRTQGGTTNGLSADIEESPASPPPAATVEVRKHIVFVFYRRIHRCRY